MAVSKRAVLWDAIDLTYQAPITRASVPAELVSGAVESVVLQSRTEIQLISQRLQQGAISLEEWYAGMKEAVKLNAMANAALARGGWEQMRPQDWQRVGDAVARQYNGEAGKFPGLRKFGEDIERGRYGPDADQASILGRAQSYADASRSIYENEKTDLHKEAGATMALRLLGAVDNCPGCLEAAGDWVPIDDILPIGDAECGAACHCTVVYQ